MEKNTDQIPVSSARSRSGPYLAKVVSHMDPTYMGMLEVEILRDVGNSSRKKEGELHQVKMITPFYGVTSVDYVNKDPNDYNNTQKSYGMWMIPPDVGTTVLIFFIDGDPKRGYWFGCVPDEAMDFMIPGLAATEYVVDGKKQERLPVAEYNKKSNDNVLEPTKAKKPKHPIADILSRQGLIKDDIRGITTSSARREVPSAVFGISTPGPIDKRSNAKKGQVGKFKKEVTAFVSRLGGTTFVMDDGDDKYLRKKPAGEAPPEYVSVEQGEKGGDVTIPHNELVRIRTRTGHQILMHNSEDLIYITNARGTTWIELTSNGKIDIFAKDSISLHTKVDLNITADRDLNFSAGRAVNFSSTGSYKEPELPNKQKLPELKRPVNGLFMTGDVIHFNTGSAGGPPPVRVPEAEPWQHHENLDPTQYTPDKTDVFRRQPLKTPEFFQKYTTKDDTFKKIRGAETKK